jgi:hypothetical protein
MLIPSGSRLRRNANEVRCAVFIDAAERHLPSGPVAAANASTSCWRTCPWAGAWLKSNGPASCPSVPMTDTTSPVGSNRSGRR